MDSINKLHCKKKITNNSFNKNSQLIKIDLKYKYINNVVSQGIYLPQYFCTKNECKHLCIQKFVFSHFVSFGTVWWMPINWRRVLKWCTWTTAEFQVKSISSRMILRTMFINWFLTIGLSQAPTIALHGGNLLLFYSI